MSWNKHPVLFKTFTLFFSFLSMTFLTSAIFSAEEYEKFLDRLQQAGFYDTGIYYLETHKDKLPQNLKSSYDFQVAILRVGMAMQITDPNRRMKELEDAAKLYQKFFKENPNHPKANEALVNYPRLGLDIAKIYSAIFAQNERLKDSERKQHMDRARKELDEVMKFLDTEIPKMLAKAKSVRDNANKEKDEKKKQGLRTQQTELTDLYNFLRYCKADATYEYGKTYPLGSKEANDRFDSAKAQYRKFWDQYSQYMTGMALNGRLREGQILLEQKKITGKDNAIFILSELASAMADVLEEPLCQQVFTESLSSLCECYIASKPNDEQKKLLAELYPKWLDCPYKKTSPEGVTLQLNYAKYLGSLAKALPEGKEKNDYISQIRKDLNSLLKSKTGRNDEIRAVLAEFTGSAMPENSKFTLDDFMTAKKYEELRPLAQTQWNIFLEKQREWVTETNPSAREIHKREMVRIGNETLPIYEKLEALKLGMLAENNPAKITTLIYDRYCRAMILYYVDKPTEASVIMDFITKRYPQETIAENSISMLIQLYPVMIDQRVRTLQETSPGISAEELQKAVSFELNALVDTVRRFARINETKGDPEKIYEAWQRVCASYIRVRDTANADNYLKNIPENSASRPDAEANVGMAIWKMYVQNLNETDPDLKVPDEEAQKWRADALKKLRDSAQKQQKAVANGKIVTEVMVGSILNLSQILNQIGNTEESLQTMLLPKIGPYTLLKEKSPLVERYRQTILTYALQAFVAENQPEEAEKVMDELEKLTSAENSGDDADAKLTQMYIRLGRSLEESIKQLTQENNPDALRKVQEGFEIFLNRIKDRDEGNTFSSLMWVAQTYTSMADGLLGPSGRAVSPKAREYYQQAIDTYTKIGAMGTEFSGRDEAGQNSLIQALSERIAVCHSKAGNYDEALQVYGLLLSQLPARLAWQMEALDILWKQFSHEKDTAEKLNILKKMRVGMHPVTNTQTGKKENAIRGLNRIIRITVNYGPSTDTSEGYLRNRGYYFKTVLWVSQNFLEQAKLSTKQEDKKTNLEKAKSYIERLYKLYDDMGGEELYKQFDETYTAIQLEEGVAKEQVKLLADTYVPPPKVAATETESEDSEENLIDVIRQKEEEKALAEIAAAEKETEENKKKVEENTKKMSPAMVYSLTGAGLLVFFIILYFALRKHRDTPVELRRKEEVQNLALENLDDIPDEEKEAELTKPVILEGISDAEAVVSDDAAANIFASLGIGDAPVTASDASLDLDVFNFGEKETPKKAGRGDSSSETPKKPAVKPDQKSEAKPAPKPAVKPDQKSEAKLAPK
ncbi:MAG: hypothetical protein Q4C96_09820, partial [Planctomycetia bacterium]|nr:hypothetical protein [Planctomycetia bacterium]